MTLAPERDGEAARRFLHLLDPDAKDFTFQTFDDKAKKKDANPRLARATSDRAEVLQLYRAGSGVWVTINQTDLTGRKSENIKRVRAVFQEDDEGYSGLFPLEPSIVVESSPRRFHRYWLSADEWPADEQGRRDFAAVMERMVESYGSDKNVKDISRVLRLPGFLHRKNPIRPHMVRIVEASGRRYSREEILQAFPPVERKKEKPQQQRELQPRQYREFQPGDCDEERIADALRFVSADDYFDWLRVGMALKDELGERGRAIWDTWSRTSDKFTECDQNRTWHAIRRHGITVATLFWIAQQHGWRPQVTSAKREACRAAGLALRRWKPTEAWKTFRHWSAAHGVDPNTAREVFNHILTKEMRCD